MRIAVVISARDAEQSNGTVDTRRFDRVDEFAAVLGRAAGVLVEVIEGSLADAPADGIVVLFNDLDVSGYPTLARRVVLMNADRSEMRAVESRELAAVVEKELYFRWRTGAGASRGYGVYGRKDVGASIGAMISGMYPSETYGMLESQAHGSLVELLGAYLLAYERLHGGD